MTMTNAIVALRRRRGNPNWGMPLLPIPALVTEFETEVARLGLTQPDYVTSMQLRRWCQHNRNRVYIPEWLLAEWKIQVEINFSAA